MTLLIFTYNCTVKKLMYFSNVYKYSYKSGQSIAHVRYKWLFIIYTSRKDTITAKIDNESL